MWVDLTLAVTPDMRENARSREPKAFDGHMGTHYDVMKKTFPLDYLKRKGVVFDVSGIMDRDIDENDIDCSLIKENMFVGFYSGQIERYEYGSDEYFHSGPQLAKSLIELLVERKVSLIGLDFAGARRGSQHPLTDQYCADHDTFIIENMVNLKQLVDRKDVTIYCFPLNYTAMSGLPCRITAEI